MKRVLIPIDFTEVSINAFVYAYNLFPKAKHKVVHSISGLYSDKAIYLKEGMDKEGIIIAELKKLICESIGVSDFPENIEIEVLHGNTIKTISKLAESFDAIVMGTRDNYDLFDKWLGTTSLGIVKSVKIPVYLIPRSSCYQKFEKALIASDYHLRNKNFIRRIIEWNEPFNAYLKFFHVSEEEEIDFDVTRDVIMEEFQLLGNSQPRFSVGIGKGENIGDEILNNAYNFGANIIITIPKQRSFFNSVFTKSVSKHLVLKTRIPVLFLPYDNEH